MQFFEDRRVRMIQHPVRFHAVALALLALAMFVPFAAFGQADAVELTAAFVDGGVTIESLLVVQIGGVVLIRGRTGDAERAAEAGRFAASRGYRRVANLIEIVPGLGGDAVESEARRELEMARALEGCRFQIDSVGGIVRLRGNVRREVQKDLAVDLVRRIDGVKEVHSELTVSLPAAPARPSAQ
jgi:osmotically-inducible protein OsmY